VVATIAHLMERVGARHVMDEPAFGRRSVDASTGSAARWTRARLGPAHRFAADTTGANLASSYGGQNTVPDVEVLYDDPTWSLSDQTVLHRRSIEFRWVDLRMSQQTPRLGRVFPGRPGGLFPGRHLSTVELLVLVPALSMAFLVPGALVLFAARVPPAPGRHPSSTFCAHERRQLPPPSGAEPASPAGRA
jgi:hypothetical protein